MKKNLKDYQEKELKAFVVGNILLVLLGTGLIYNIVEPLEIDNIWKAIAELFSSSVLSAIIYIFVFCLDSIVSADFKYRVAWPLAGLPGNRIFTEIRENNRDDRFTTELALEAYSSVYKMIDAEKDKKKRARIQNSSWYKMYQKYESEVQVAISQRDFLLCRDMMGMMIWMLIGFLFLSCYLGQGVSCKLIIVLTIEFFALRRATRVKGRRFTYNVIAKDIAGYSREAKSHSVIE